MVVFTFYSIYNLNRLPVFYIYLKNSYRSSTKILNSDTRMFIYDSKKEL